MSEFLFKKTLIIGLGLIGGSFAKAISKSKLSNKIFAYDLDEETIDLAKNDKIIDGGVTDLSFFLDEISEFDLIVLATPISSYQEIFDELAGKISNDSTVIDLGSIKDLKIKNLPKNFIPCHPIAGSQEVGFENSDANLFQDKKFIICAKNCDKILELGKRIGAKPEFLEAKKHDEIYALVSHLPQFLSFLTAEFSPKKIEDNFFKTAFRLDDSSPEIWSDIFELNQKNLEKFYLKFFDELEKSLNSLDSRAKTSENISSIKIDEKFFEENFAAIFFRALVVESFLKIPEIKSYQSFAGQGFIDFCSIIEIFNFDQIKLQNLLKTNKQKILKIFNSLS